MAYIPKEWECGDTITADRLNNLEEGIQEALECCGGGGSAEYECEMELTTLYPTDNVEFYDDAPDYYYCDAITATLGADTIKLTFDGTEYFLDKFVYINPLSETYIGYGGSFVYDLDLYDWVYDFSECPISIMQEDGSSDAYLYTSIGGLTHSIKIESVSATVENISPCFKVAANASNESFIVHFFHTTGGLLADHTYAEIIAAWNSGKNVIGVHEYGGVMVISNLSLINNGEITFCSIFTNYGQAPVLQTFVIASNSQQVAISEVSLATL